MRAKRILGLKNINIYALGIYVDDAAAKRALAGRFKAASAEAISKDQTMFDGERMRRRMGPCISWRMST